MSLVYVYWNLCWCFYLQSTFINLTFFTLHFTLRAVSEIEESMLSALRPPEHAPPVPPPPRISSDPSLLPPDRLHVEMELSPDSHITLYGPLLRSLVSIKVHMYMHVWSHMGPGFLNWADVSLKPPTHVYLNKLMSFTTHSSFPYNDWLKWGWLNKWHCSIPLKWLLCLSVQENYFGEDDMYTDFEESLSSPVLSSCSSGLIGVSLEENRSKDAPHPLSLRPWDITVLINLHKVHGRLPTVSTASGYVHTTTI